MPSVLSLLLAGASTALAADWAVLVAGSKTWGNYRHQSDVCHAYQVTKQFGIPDERIIVFQYDDLAKYASNPYPGQIFNHPTDVGTAGIDVYDGCKTDYTGAEVTVANFVAVLTGDSATASGPVLQSTAEDNVFVNFVDHGGVGIVAFPSETLQVAKLQATLEAMQTRMMYKKLVFYLEACEAGSMFEQWLPANMGIYATTASNAGESSWGTYCPPDDSVNGKVMNTCLGDLYSVNWMQQADSMGKDVTLQEQFVFIQNATDKSHVMQYGDMSFTSDPIGDFMGDTMSKTNMDKPVPNPAGIVNSRDIPMHLAYYQYLRAMDADHDTRIELAEELLAQVTHRVKTDKIFHGLAVKIAGEETGPRLMTAEVTQACGACCEAAHNAVEQFCGGYSDYSLKYARTIANLCTATDNTAGIVAGLQSMC